MHGKNRPIFMIMYFNLRETIIAQSSIYDRLVVFFSVKNLKRGQICPIVKVKVAPSLYFGYTGTTYDFYSDYRAWY